MEEKICCKCKLSKPLNKFGNLKSSKQDDGYQVITEMLLWLRTKDSGMVKNPQMTHYYSDEMDDPQPSS